MSPARACAFAVARRVFEQGAYADRAFASEAADLQARDRSLGMRIAYGVVQRRATLDHLAARLLRPELSRLEPAVLAAVRVGLFQVLYLDGIPDHAAVGESVELVKRTSPGGAKLVNAVLRRAVREGPALLERLDDDGPQTAAVMHSVPVWLAEMWWRELGAEEARALLRSVNEPAESAVRVNLLVSSAAEASERLPVPHRPAPDLPEGLVLDGPFDAQGSALWAAGAIMPQSRASMLVSRVLAPQRGQLVLDLCAAPGGKTTHLAALMEGTGSVHAAERHPGRAEALERTVRRMQAHNVVVDVLDAAELPTLRPQAVGLYHSVLVDPPCSGLGTLQSRPDLRWRVSPQDVAELVEVQSRILRAGAACTTPGGTLVYSVCTISAAEGRGVVERFLDRHPAFSADELGAQHPQWADHADPRYLQLLPHRDGTDGFFIARLRREPRPPAT
ncbi:MAG: 16S rRNA (cytosine(967)-C(5))-methyltransferase RsmB [Solirubrobacteraceae bacterium]